MLGLALAFATPGTGQTTRSSAAAFGSLDGPDALGEVTDALSLIDGSVVVLDRLSSRVLWFSADGELTHSFGRKGKGPGEFTWPIALDADSLDRVLVLDPGNRRISALVPSNAGVKLAAEYPIDFLAQDMCSLGDRLFVLGLRNETGVHEVRGSDGVVHSFYSFPEPGKAEERFEQRYLADGRLICDSRRGTVTVAPRIRPDVLTFSAEGRLLRTTTLPDYRETRLVVIGRGSYRLEPDPETGSVNQLAGAAATPAGLLLQVEERGFSGRIGSVRSWLIGSSGRLVPTEAPNDVIGAFPGGLITRTEDPFPQVRTWQERHPR